jgi:hypothetical protein
LQKGKKSGKKESEKEQEKQKGEKVTKIKVNKNENIDEKKVKKMTQLIQNRELNINIDMFLGTDFHSIKYFLGSNSTLKEMTISNRGKNQSPDGNSNIISMIVI